MTQFDEEVNAYGPVDLVSIDAAAAEFQISRSTLYRLITRSSTPRYKRPGDRKTYVSRAQVAKLVAFKEL